MAVKDVRIYRLVVDSWPTPDGRPFDEQTPEFWNDIADRFFEPDPERPLPAWVPDLTPWAGSHLGRPEILGHWIPEAHLVVPTVGKRAHYLSANTPYLLRKTLKHWGCSARVEKSEPIEWSKS